MTPVPVEVAAGVAAGVLGGPVTLEVLKDKPGRRRTMRARGAAGSVIIKTYASHRAGTVAARVAALASGPPEPAVPRVLHLDVERRMVILSEVPGTALRVAVLHGDQAACRSAGAALATWHGAWAGRGGPLLRRHGVERELAVLRQRGAPTIDPALRRPWSCTTVVHRDLYEDQIMTGSVVGLIDLDDAHRGPPELDVGNLLAHLALLDARSGSAAGAAAAAAVLAGYAAAGGPLNGGRLAQCERLSAIRLGCIHGISPGWAWQAPESLHGGDGAQAGITVVPAPPDQDLGSTVMHVGAAGSPSGERWSTAPVGSMASDGPVSPGCGRAVPSTMRL